jgi:hypothetical protein
VAFEKNWQGYEETASAPYAWELGRAVTLAVDVAGSRMVGYVDGEMVLEWEDPEDTWKSGCVGLGVKNGRTLFTRVSLSPAY